MCKCTPNIRTPFCGKEGCQWPKPEGTRVPDVRSQTMTPPNTEALAEALQRCTFKYAETPFSGTEACLAFGYSEVMAKRVLAAAQAHLATLREDKEEGGAGYARTAKQYVKDMYKALGSKAYEFDDKLNTILANICEDHKAHYKDYTVWLLEKEERGRILYLYYDEWGFKFTPDANEAIHFARRKDADAVGGGIEDFLRIVEHMWPDVKAAQKKEGE